MVEGIVDDILHPNEGFAERSHRKASEHRREERLADQRRMKEEQATWEQVKDIPLDPGLSSMTNSPP